VLPSVSLLAASHRRIACLCSIRSQADHPLQGVSTFEQIFGKASLPGRALSGGLITARSDADQDSADVLQLQLVQMPLCGAECRSPVELPHLLSPSRHRSQSDPRLEVRVTWPSAPCPP
jgi:hypothetical protein